MVRPGDPDLLRQIRQNVCSLRGYRYGEPCQRGVEDHHIVGRRIPEPLEPAGQIREGQPIDLAAGKIPAPVHLRRWRDPEPGNHRRQIEALRFGTHAGHRLGTTQGTREELAPGRLVREPLPRTQLTSEVLHRACGDRRNAGWSS
jgi:hypothetical protein